MPDWADRSTALQMPRWPFAAIVLLLGFMFVVPLLGGARREALRAREEATLGPARAALVEMRRAFVTTVADTRGFLITRDTAYLARLRSNLAELDDASTDLRAVAATLGSEVDTPVRDLLTHIATWVDPVEDLVDGSATPDDLIRGLDAGQQGILDALDAAAAVDRALGEIETLNRNRINRAERLDNVLVGVSGLAAVLIGIFIGWLVRRLLATSRHLTESETRFRQIAENLREAIWIADPAYSTYFYVNPAYEKIWGRPIEEALRNPRSFLDAVHPDDRKRVEAAMEGYAVGQYDTEYRIVRADGEVRWIRARAYPVRDARGRIFRVAGIAEDVTRRRRAEEERESLLRSERRARTELEAALRVRDRVLRIVSHDLKNPLHTVGMAVDLLEMPISAAQRSKQLEIVRRTIKRANRMVLDLLDASRIESGKAIAIEAHPVEIESLLTEAVDAFNGIAGEKEVDLKCEVDAGTPAVLADHDRTIQVLTNLLDNAVKFTPRGGRVELRAAPGGADHVLVSVSDTGPGIAPDLRPTLFQPFAQAKDTASLGTGLGLSIVKGIVEAQGGEISVESRVGEGTTFCFTLPTATPPSGESRGSGRKIDETRRSGAGAPRGDA